MIKDGDIFAALDMETLIDEMLSPSNQKASYEKNNDLTNEFTQDLIEKFNLKLRF